MAVKLTAEMIKGARETERLTGVPASITLAQIIEESSGSYEGGLSGLAYEGKNLFGVRSWSSDPNEYIEMVDTWGRKLKWKKYDTFYESILDHAKIIGMERYKVHYQNADDIQDYADALVKGGYAENEKYADNLVYHINTYNLNEYNLSNDFNFDKDRVSFLSKNDFLSDIRNSATVNETESGSDKEKTGSIIGLLFSLPVLIIVMIVMMILLFKGVRK